ncbi:MAG: hypothetical protein ABSD88_09855 [Candidatus Korobacteraceae bacterium]|jgi:hypothetical protein
MIVTDEQFERFAKEELCDAELLPAHLTDETQFLNVGVQAFFIELVLTDAEKLEAARAAVRKLQQRLQREGASLEIVVRCNWRVQTVRYGGYCTDEHGAPRTAECYKVLLVGAGTQHTVTVEVLYQAAMTAKEVLGSQWPDNREHQQRLLADLVRIRIEDALEHGGKSYWDPIRYPALSIDSVTMEQMIRLRDRVPAKWV